MLQVVLEVGPEDEKRLEIERRLWAKVNMLGTCWEWLGATSRRGYGQFRIGCKKHLATHRLAYAWYRGSISDGLFVCHRCDNPRCVRPDHLFLGTHADNMVDMIAKGRSNAGDRNGARLHPERRPCGERNVQAKLTEELVLTIRTRHLTGRATVATLSEEFHISRKQVERIVGRRYWKHVPASWWAKLVGDVACYRDAFVKLFAPVLDADPVRVRLEELLRDA